MPWWVVFGKGGEGVYQGSARRAAHNVSDSSGGNVAEALSDDYDEIERSGDSSEDSESSSEDEDEEMIQTESDDL